MKDSRISLGGSSGSDRGMSRFLHGTPLALLIILLLAFIYATLPVLEVIAISALLAFAFRSFIYWLGKLGIPHKLGAIIVILVMIGAGFGFWLFIIPNVISESSNLVHSLRGSFSSLTDIAKDLHNRYSFLPDISGSLSNITSQLQGGLSRIVDILPRFVTTTATLLAWAVAGLVMFIYMAYDPTPLVRGVERLIPQGKRPEFRELLFVVSDRLRGWIIGTILAVLIIGIGASLGLTLLGIPLALTLGVIAGLLDIIPFFGSIAGAILPIIIALTISPIKAVFVLLLFIGLNQLESHIVQPLVVGPRIHLHPVVVIMSLLIAEALLGYIGFIFALPAAAILVAVLDETIPSDPPSKPEADQEGESESDEATSEESSKTVEQPQK